MHARVNQIGGTYLLYSTGQNDHDYPKFKTCNACQLLRGLLLSKAINVFGRLEVECVFVIMRS